MKNRHDFETNIICAEAKSLSKLLQLLLISMRKFNDR